MILKTGRSREQNLTTLYCTAILTAFALYLPDISLGQYTMRWMLFAVLTIMAFGGYVFLLSTGKAHCRRTVCPVDLCMAAWLLLSLGQVVLKALRGQDGYEGYLLASVCVLAYFLLSAPVRDRPEAWRGDWPDWYLGACAVAYAALLISLLLSPQGEGAAWLCDGEGAAGPFLVLGAAAGILQYCGSRKRAKDKRYLAVAATGFFLLFLRHDVPGILLTGSLFLLVPLLFLPTAELIKRNLIMAFVYLFLLSNMPFITKEGRLAPLQPAFPVPLSICLDVLLAAAGVIVISYRERLPEQVPPDRIVLRRVRKWFLAALRVCVILLAAMLCGPSLGLNGPSLGLNGHIGDGLFKLLVDGVRAGFGRTCGAFGQAAQDYGAVGVILAAVTFAAVAARLKKIHTRGGGQPALTVLAVIFIAQSFLYRQQAATLPAYTVFVTLALFQEDRGRMNTT